MMEKSFQKIPRPPVVVVMGHVDHGKTTLLDYIRKTNIAAREAGGITQSIGAYEIEHTPKGSTEKKRITFIDTPGHEAFSNMRRRGAHVADLAIIVIAADDGVKSQTKEAIQIAKESKTPFIVAINKIDKNNADIERVKKDLAAAGVLLEGYGGDVSWQGISAKTGEGIDELLDLILLAAELEGLTYDPEARGEGVVIEAKLDRRRGNEVSVIVLNGMLREGDKITAGGVLGRIKVLENFAGKRVKELVPSSPALILGFEKLPQVGDVFISGQVDLAKENIKEATKFPRSYDTKTGGRGDGSDKLPLPLILKADYAGTLEALSELVRNLPQSDTVPEIVFEDVGDINDNDVQLAISTAAIIVGFRVKASKSAEQLAASKGVRILLSDIIYELTKTIEEALSKKEEPSLRGELEVLAVFGSKGNKQIIGGRVISGVLKNRSQAEIIRKNIVLGRGKILNLQLNKQDVSEVEEGRECGVLFESGFTIQVGDHLII